MIVYLSIENFDTDSAIDEYLKAHKEYVFISDNGEPSGGKGSTETPCVSRVRVEANPS